MKNAIMLKIAGNDKVFAYPKTLRTISVNHNASSGALDTPPGIYTVLARAAPSFAEAKAGELLKADEWG